MTEFIIVTSGLIVCDLSQIFRLLAVYRRVFQSIQFPNVTRLVAPGSAIALLCHFFGISPTFVSLICSLVLVRGCFQASPLGISVMTGSVRLYLSLPCNGHYLAIAMKAPGRKRKPIILQSSVICYCGKMVSLVPDEVFYGIGLILFVITNFMSIRVLYFNFLCAFVHRFRVICTDAFSI